jgi:hypothetical protein
MNETIVFTRGGVRYEIRIDRLVGHVGLVNGEVRFASDDPAKIVLMMINFHRRIVATITAQPIREAELVG